MPSKSKKESRGVSSKSQQNRTQVQEDGADFIEGVNDLDDDVRAQLPSQDH